MRRLLTAACGLLVPVVLAQPSQPQLLTLRKAALFEKLTATLEAEQLARFYRASLKLQQVRLNRHAPGIKDSVLLAATPADRLTLLKNRYTTLLLGATFRSTKVSFGGLKVGVTKEVFCRTLHLSPAYTVYAFTDGVENLVQLTCTFANGKLQSVAYQYLVNPDDID